MLQGKTGIVFGVANHRSLAWFITKALSNAGAKLAITYQDKRFEHKLKKLTEEELPNKPLALLCDIRDDTQIENVYRQLHESYGRLDFIVHCIAFASREDLEGQFIQTSRPGFLLSMEVSVYSLLAVVRPALPLMEKEGSIVTLSYLGGQRVVQNYNVMGVAKAALESSFVIWQQILRKEYSRKRSLAPDSQCPFSTGIKGFTGFLGHIRERAPMRRNIEGEEIGSAALFLCSDLSRGITGETIYVDAGYHIMGS